jgi:hypothetical protein
MAAAIRVSEATCTLKPQSKNRRRYTVNVYVNYRCCPEFH